jgi:hypothetical protein
MVRPIGPQTPAGQPPAAPYRPSRQLLDLIEDTKSVAEPVFHNLKNARQTTPKKITPTPSA